MKKLYSFYFISLFLIASSLQGQIVKRDSKIRIGFGLAGFSQNDINSVMMNLENLAKERHPESGFSPPHFIKHLYYTLEYEVEIDQTFSYMFTIEIHNDRVSGSDVNYVNYVSQYINFGLNYISAGVSIVYYYPFFNTRFGPAKVFTALGVDLLYTNIDIYHYYNEVTKSGPQEINLNSTGYNAGGKGFVGLEVPFSQTIFIQLRGGFSYRKASEFSSTIKTNKQKPIDPSFINKQSYNLSGFWGNLGIAFYF